MYKSTEFKFIQGISLRWFGSVWNSYSSLSPDESILRKELEPSTENAECATVQAREFSPSLPQNELPSEWARHCGQDLAWRCSRTLEGTKPFFSFLPSARGLGTCS